MTREEAIKKLRWFKAYNEEDYCGGDRIQDELGDWYYLITEQDFEAFEMAIKALEQEPCDDAVSRKQAIEFVNEVIGGKNELADAIRDGVEAVLSALPPVTPQEPKFVPIAEFKYDKDKLKELVDEAVLTVAPQEPKWIPVTEKLPNKDGEYLLFGKITEDEDNYIFVGEYDSCGEQFGIWQEQFDRATLGCLGSEFFEYSSVIAWQPLPKPYKAESEVEA